MLYFANENFLIMASKNLTYPHIHTYFPLFLVYLSLLTLDLT